MVNTEGFSKSKVYTNSKPKTLKPKERDEYSKIHSKTIFDQIQKIREDNNKNWMDLMRLAFSTSPDRAKTVMKKIVECDKKIKDLCKELIK